MNPILPADSSTALGKHPLSEGPVFYRVTIETMTAPASEAAAAAIRSRRGDPPANSPYTCQSKVSHWLTVSEMLTATLDGFVP